MRAALLSIALLAAASQAPESRPLGLQAVDGYRQSAARNFVVHAEDFTLSLPKGTVLQRETRGITTLVLVGKGEMRFSPAPESEKSQIRLMGRTDVLQAPFDVAVIATSYPGAHADLSQLVPEATDPSVVRTAEKAFPDVGVSPDTYTASFGPRDLIADISTARYGALRYWYSESSPEAISLVERKSRKTLAIYPSLQQIATRGRAYRDEDRVDYDVLHHDVSLSYDPARRFIEGVASMRVRITGDRVAQIPIRLAANLRVQSITIPGMDPPGASRNPLSEEPLLLRLSSPLARGTEITIVVAYSGTVDPPAAEWDIPQPAVQTGPPQPRQPQQPPRAQLTSTVPMWYPRPPFIDYATATLRISVPSGFDCVATGELADGSPEVEATAPSRKLFTFTARQPVRHLAFLVAPFTPVSHVQLAVEDGPGSQGLMSLTTVTQAGSGPTAPAVASAAADIVQFYRSIIGDVPYSSLTVALVDGQVPGGHSAGYFSAVGQPPAGTDPFWRSDPAAYDTFPNFLLAHEIAHQWWGQVVGWSTYHDQWMSEAFAQYFAMLHAGHQRSGAIPDVLRRMRMWGMSESPKGPLSLGPRLGEVQGDDRVFRALLYNKGPAVLHMLRRFIGDEAFFEGVRRFYRSARFSKPSTADLQAAMEAASGHPLARFFERWVEGTALPQLRFSYRVEPRQGTNGDVILHIEQTGDLFDLPVTAVLQYADRPAEEHVLRVSDRSTDMRVPLTGRLRRAEISRDDGTLADVR